MRFGPKQFTVSITRFSLCLTTTKKTRICTCSEGHRITYIDYVEKALINCVTIEREWMMCTKYLKYHIYFYYVLYFPDFILQHVTNHAHNRSIKLILLCIFIVYLTAKAITQIRIFICISESSVSLYMRMFTYR